MDIRYDEMNQDILSPAGFANHMYQCLRLRPGSGKFSAPVCSSWVYMRLGDKG